MYSFRIFKKYFEHLEFFQAFVCGYRYNGNKQMSYKWKVIKSTA